MTAPAKIHRPAHVCSALLAALEAAEGRRKRRKRDQTPDAIGLAVKRELLKCIVREDPEPHMFESWLLRYAHAYESTPLSGAVGAMARTILDEWRLAHAMREFAAWLENGARSDDAEDSMAHCSFSGSDTSSESRPSSKAHET